MRREEGHLEQGDRVAGAETVTESPVIRPSLLPAEMYTDGPER